MRFIQYKDINLSEAIASLATVEIFRKEVPQGIDLKVTDFGNYLNVFDAWGFVMWTLKQNGNAIAPYHEIMDQLGYSAQLRSITVPMIPGGDVFTIEIYNGHDVEVACGIALKYQMEARE